jgi:hypothetical protein
VPLDSARVEFAVRTHTAAATPFATAPRMRNLVIKSPYTRRLDEVAGYA